MIIAGGGDGVVKYKSWWSKGTVGIAQLILTKNLTRASFLLALAANMLGGSQFSIGCMKWQHAVFWESICETDLIIIFLPA